MKKCMALLQLLILLIVFLPGCGQQKTEISNENVNETVIHRIGVATYNIKDAQVVMFKDYLNGYIADCFEDVEFIYSDSLSSKDEMMEFLRLCADAGCEAIMSFNSYDLKEEVEFCASKEMYYIRPSSYSADDDFNAVSDNKWFLGEIGPGFEKEIQACVDMVRSMTQKDDGRNFIILSGGAFMGVEMHRIRTVALLNTLAEVYGIKFEKEIDELAVVSVPTEISDEKVSIIICPGFVELPQYGDPASAAITSGRYTTVLSTIAVTPLMDAISAVEIHCGATDCFSEDNFFGFKKGKVSYIAGKYESEIGPAFAAVYNAITGNADVCRQDGKAFRLEQGYWTAADNSTYDSMYALSSGISINAYSAEDLYSVIKIFNADTNFEQFKALTESYSYENALARRAL